MTRRHSTQIDSRIISRVDLQPFTRHGPHLPSAFFAAVQNTSEQAAQIMLRVSPEGQRTGIATGESTSATRSG